MKSNNPGNVFIERGMALNNCYLGPNIRVGYRSYANDTIIRSRVEIPPALAADRQDLALRRPI